MQVHMNYHGIIHCLLHNSTITMASLLSARRAQVKECPRTQLLSTQPVKQRCFLKETVNVPVITYFFHSSENYFCLHLFYTHYID